MFTAHTKDKKYNVELDLSTNKGTVNGKNFELNLIKTGENHIHVIKDDKSYNISVVEADYANKQITLHINGHLYNVNINDDIDILLNGMGMNRTTQIINKDIKAPMPGLLANIYVKPGDEVKKGDILLVLEAMKMENNIKSHIDGVIKAISANKGKSVEKNEILITFE